MSQGVSQNITNLLYFLGAIFIHAHCFSNMEGMEELDTSNSRIIFRLLDEYDDEAHKFVIVCISRVHTLDARRPRRPRPS